MNSLLNNRFAPITFTWGFVESPFVEVSEAFTRWQDQLHAECSRMEWNSFRAPISESLLALEPLTTPQDRDLLVETDSRWTAIFSNGLRVNDVHSSVSYLPLLLKCRGLEVACVPDRSKCHAKDALQIYGAVVFTLYGQEQKNWVNRIRHISVMNDVAGWEFFAEGEIQSYEQTENYPKQRIVDRFTPDMLESYCAALGIDLFNPNFYGPQNLLGHTIRAAASAQGPKMSIAEARSHVCIPES